MTSITIPNSVTSIGSRAFYNCRGLTTLNFNAINCQDFSSLRHPFSGTSLTTVNIGDSVQRIPANFVRGCSGLTSVTIPNSVTSIGIYAFYAYGSNAVRNGNRSQAATTVKRTPSDVSNAVRNSNRSQAATTVKRTPSDGSNAVRNSNRSQAATTVKRTISYFL